MKLSAQLTSGGGRGLVDGSESGRAATPRKPSFWRRCTAGVPLLITIGVHVVLIGLAGYFVTERIVQGPRNVFVGQDVEPPKPPEKRFPMSVSHGASAGGGAATVAQGRILTNAAGALELPSLPDLVQPGASLLSGTNFAGITGGVGMGVDGLLNTTTGMRGGAGGVFMAPPLFGQLGAEKPKVVLVVEAGSALLDIRKGGFHAFAIIREQIARLVAALPYDAEFNVVFFENHGWRPEAVAAFDAKLRPATAANKQAFLDWIAPVNAKPEAIGMRSVPGKRVAWSPRALAGEGIDEALRPPAWAQALHYALELQPDTIFVIAGTAGDLQRALSPAELAKVKREHEEHLAAMKRDGLDLDAVNQARGRFLAKARAQLDEINRKLREQGKAPYVVTDIRRVFDADFQAELKRRGFSIALDTTGWADKQGRPIWWTGYTSTRGEGFDELVSHVAKLKRALTTEPVAVNFFLFVGPDEKPAAAMSALSEMARRNGGRFELLTTKRLEEIVARDQAGLKP